MGRACVPLPLKAGPFNYTMLSHGVGGIQRISFLPAAELTTQYDQERTTQGADTAEVNECPWGCRSSTIWDTTGFTPEASKLCCHQEELSTC